MDLEKLTGQVCRLCEETAAYIREQSRLLTATDIEEKERKSLVTYVDRTSEQKLVSALGRILPGSDFLAEEFEYPRLGGVYTWVIDPLDGTTNFVHGLPVYAISVALMKEDEIISGVVYEVAHGECFYAWKGSQAYLNGDIIRVSGAASLEASLLVTGFPYKPGDKLEPYMDIFKELVVKCHGMRRLGSAATDLCYVASGRLDGFYEFGLNPWDVAAGALIVRQAGGRITDFRLGPGFLHGKELLATNGRVHEELSEIITRHFF